MMLSSINGRLATMDLATRSITPIGVNLSNRVANMKSSPDGRRIAAATSNQELFVLDSSSGMLLSSPVKLDPLNGGDPRLDQVPGLDWTPDGLHFATASSRNIAGLWESSTLKSLATWTTNAPFTSLDVSPDGRWLALGNMNSCA